MLFGGLLELELVLAYDAIFFLFVCYAYEYDVMSFFFFFLLPLCGLHRYKKVLHGWLYIQGVFRASCDYHYSFKIRY